MKISIETKVNATLADVWHAWTTPSDIIQWNFASDDWCCPHAEIDLVEGGVFNYRMEAKSGEMGFDFRGTFTKVINREIITYVMEDGRQVVVSFEDTVDGVIVRETFDAENENSAELQRQGWQSILNTFKQHVESSF